MELFEKGEESQRKYVKGMRVTPNEPEFTFDYFDTLIDDLVVEKKRSVKGLLTQDQIIPGLGNASAQDIMFRARLHPKQPINVLSSVQKRELYDAILTTVNKIIEQGGRYDEYDLFNERGGYIRLMDKNTVGHPCSDCGSSIEKMQYLGGACYFCPTCQKLN
jgi:formamidopyrimidine-DNA glycosylase